MGTSWQRLCWLAVGWLAALLTPQAALARDATITAGRAIVANGVRPGRPGCAACHMQDGSGQPDVGIPRLAGLTSSYIRGQIADFASGSRRNAAMSPYAIMLSPAQREAVADYFASLPIPTSSEPPDLGKGDIARGRMLFLDGDAGANILACASCHGPTGLGVGDFSPRLAGQSGPYVAAQLSLWHAGDLRDPRGAFMRAEAAHLTTADIAAVAAYVASLKAAGSTP